MESQKPRTAEKHTHHVESHQKIRSGGKRSSYRVVRELLFI